LPNVLMIRGDGWRASCASRKRDRWRRRIRKMVKHEKFITTVHLSRGKDDNGRRMLCQVEPR
jgi:hypothetical protein